VAAYAASLLTYPLALAFLAVLFLVDLYPLRRFRLSLSEWRHVELRQALVEKVPYGMVVGIVFSLTLWARTGASGMWRPPPTLAEFGVLERVMQGFYVWASYLWASIVPRDLSPVYTSLVRFDPMETRFLASAFLVVAISALVAWKWRRWPGAAVGWACYLLILVPMLGLTEHPHYVNDRYSYLPGLALAALVAGGAFQLWQHRSVRIPALAIAGGASVLCGLLTATQVRAWHDTDTLFAHMITKMGDSPYRADTYCRLGNRRMSQGRWEEAKGYFTDSTNVAPAFVPGYRGLGEALSRQGRGEEAANVLIAALNVRTPTADLRVRAAEALADVGRYAEASEQFRAALERTPGYGQAMNGLAWLLATCPDASLRDGKVAVALAEKIAEATDHQVAMVETTLAAAYAEAGDFGKATTVAQTAGTLAAKAGDTNVSARASAVLQSVHGGSAYRTRTN
jgi:Tfp pilus assembly protein PilF